MDALLDHDQLGQLRQCLQDSYPKLNTCGNDVHSTLLAIHRVIHELIEFPEFPDQVCVFLLWSKRKIEVVQNQKRRFFRMRLIHGEKKSIHSQPTLDVRCAQQLHHCLHVPTRNLALSRYLL